MNKILVVRYDTIGDCIFASAFYRELRHNFPDAQIDALVDLPAKSLLVDCPYIDNFIDIFHQKYKYLDAFKYLPIFKQYDTVFFLKHARTFSILCKLANIQNRIGFDVKRNKFLTIKVPYNEDKHEVDCYLNLLRSCNLQIKNEDIELWLNDKSLNKTNKLIEENTLSNSKDSPIVLIQAFSRIKEKNWIDDYWIPVIEYLSKNHNAKIYYLGGKKDKKQYINLNKKIIKSCGREYGTDLSGKISVSETVALVSKANLVISIDSCAAHMAAALKVPGILIHGTTSLTRWRPKSDLCKIASKYFPCSPCTYQTGAKRLCKKTTPECLKALKPQDVIDIIKDFLNDKNTKSKEKQLL